MTKKFFKIILLFICFSLLTNCGKKGDLEQPGKTYPKEYPSE